MSKSSNTDNILETKSLYQSNLLLLDLSWHNTHLLFHFYFIFVWNHICGGFNILRHMFFLELHRKFLSELSIQDLHPLNLNLELLVTICQSGKVTNEILTRFLQEFLQCAAVINLPFGFMFLHRAALLRSSSRSCKNGSVEASGLHVPTYKHQFALKSTWPAPQSGFTFFSAN